MAITASLYNHTAKKFANKEVTLTTLKLMLLNNSASFVATHTALNDVTNTGAYEVSGFGWTSGGITLASVAITTVDTSSAMLDAADITVTATGGTIGPAYKGLIYDDTGDQPLIFIDFDGAKSAGATADFKVVWSANGIIRWVI